MILTSTFARAAALLALVALSSCSGATSADVSGPGAGRGPAAGTAPPDPKTAPVPGHGPVAATAPCAHANVTFGSGEGIPSAIEVDDTRIYWLTHAGAQAAGGVKLRAAGKCGAPAVTLAVGPYFAEGLAQDASTLFFATSIGSGQGALLSVSKSGGAAVTLKQGDFRPSGIAVDDTSIYWVDAYEAAIYKMPKTGGAATLLATNLSPGKVTSPDRIALDGGYVFAAGQGGVAKIPVGGGAATFIFKDAVDDLRAAGGALLIAARSGLFALTVADGSTRRLSDSGNRLCVSVQDVAFVAGGVVELHRVPLLGGADDLLASGPLGPSVVACDAGSAYWAGSGQITRTALR